MKLLQLQAPGMEAITPITGSGRLIDALMVQIQRITKKWGPQLSQVNADLMRASGCDGQLQTISLSATFHQHHFAVRLQASANLCIPLWNRSPDPAQQWMRPFDHIGIDSEGHSELKPGNTLRPGLIELATA